MTRRTRIAGVLLPVLSAPASWTADGSSIQAPVARAPALVELVESFFRSNDEKTRASLLSAIETAARGSTSAVAGAMEHVRLWRPLPQGQTAFEFELAEVGTITVAYRLPADYDPSNRYPMLVCMPGGEASPEATLAAAVELLQGLVGSFVLVCPDRPIGGSFHHAVPAEADLPSLLRETRRRMHVDSDRTFLFGAGSGGDAAWLAVITHSDLFAGAIILSGYPRVPFAQQAYPVLLVNLTSTPVLSVWAAMNERTATARQRTVAAHNRAVMSVARRAGLPITGVQLPGDGFSVPAAPLRTMLERRRAAPARHVAHWFRYPEQGHAVWLSETRFSGRVWKAQQISILPAAPADRDGFVTEVITSKLGYLGGRIERQTITVETQRCARIELMLSEGLVDLDGPITVRCNGKKRFEGPVPRSIRTLLRSAYDNWDFQRPCVARLSFTVKVDRRHGRSDRAPSVRASSVHTRSDESPGD